MFFSSLFSSFFRRFKSFFVSPSFPKGSFGESLLAPVLYLFGLILLMFGLSYASVPLYQLFCRFYGNGSPLFFKSFFVF
jgi:hypothetical protein